MDTLTAARIQMELSLAFHMVFAVFKGHNPATASTPPEVAAHGRG